MRDDVFGALPGLAAATWRDRIALVAGDRSYSFGDVDCHIDETARGLMAMGVESGDRVALLLTNRPEFVFALYAIQKIGAIAVPLNTRYREHDLGYALAFARCKLLILVDRSGPVDFLEMVTSVLHRPEPVDGPLMVKGFPDLERVVVLGERQVGWTTPWTSLGTLAAKTSAESLKTRADAVSPDDTCLIVYTSGTTGLPKGVMHNRASLRNCRERAQAWGIQPGWTTVNYLPMFHLYSLSEIVIGAMLTGVRQVIMDGFDADKALDLIERYGAEVIHGFDAHYVDILNALNERPRDLPNLRLGTFPSGLESSIPVVEEAQRRLCPTVSGFGMSETWAWISITTPDDTLERRCRTSGKPLPGVEMRIADIASDASLPDGQPGEIQVRGYTLMQGYFRDPDATKRCYTEDGWFRTGDQGVMSQGFVQFQGRYKEMLRVGGENVSAVGVETELRALVADIRDVAVVPFPDTRLGEVVVAYVVAHPDRRLTQEDIQHACRGKIASFKIPRHVIFVGDLPMTASGKVQRSILRERARSELPGEDARR